MKPVDLSPGLSFDSDELAQPVDLKLESQITLALEDGTLTLSQAQVEVGKTELQFALGEAGKMTGGLSS